MGSKLISGFEPELKAIVFYVDAMSTPSSSGEFKPAFPSVAIPRLWCACGVHLTLRSDVRALVIEIRSTLLRLQIILDIAGWIEQQALAGTDELIDLQRLGQR